ncbi:hypothetical protein MSUIS_06660 [Mycoplasma suis KI3806]|uniref:Uncharacterized protein n=1 Tax=Mycoplasma suis (strain KI_3806) TaxID=708248 RepID=F0V278_MYCS3|nr:hypothetical protein [Mycoplasma suis]CBZ40759.1 hypothetical protein MSUIS_06660 [Mycoplasma suis KI3806]
MNWVTVVPLLLVGGGIGVSSQFARHWAQGTSWFERKKHGMQMDREDGKSLPINGTNVILMGNGWEGFATELERVLKSTGQVHEITTIGKIGDGQETICKLGEGGKQVKAKSLWDKDVVWTGKIDEKGVSCFKQGTTSQEQAKK